ncbi:MAG: hypothetical protein ACJ8DU_01655 [Microvirga sp.]
MTELSGAMLGLASEGGAMPTLRNLFAGLSGKAAAEAVETLVRSPAVRIERIRKYYASRLEAAKQLAKRAAQPPKIIDVSELTRVASAACHPQADVDGSDEVLGLLVKR